MFINHEYIYKILEETKNPTIEEIRAVLEKAKQRNVWRTNDRCQYCGGELRGFFSKKCVSCGKPKDY